MPLVPAKCTQCGSALTVEPAQDAAICPFCNTPFVTEKAINNYNTTNNINAETVNIFQSSESDFIIRAGVLEKYNGSSESVVLPDDVRYIGQKAFSNCYGLNSVELNEGLVEIGYDAFFGCKNLTNIAIPDSVETISNGAFGYCEKLTSVSIGKSVKKIGMQAFSNCKNLKSISIPDGVEFVDSMAFMDCVSLNKVSVSNSMKEIKSSTFSGCRSLKSIIIPDSVTQIDIQAFIGCSDLREIVFSKNLKEISAGAFQGCTSLITLSFPLGLEKIDDGYDTSIQGAFYGCTNLKKINFPQSIISKTEAANSFGECINLTDVEISSEDLLKLTSKVRTSDGREYRRFDRFKGSVYERKINDVFEQGLCIHCGGKLKGIFKKTCEICKREKDY